MSIRMVISLLVYLYSTSVTLNILGINDFGIYNVVCGFVSMFTFLNTSMSNGIQRFYNFELGRNGTDGAKRIFISSCIIQIALCTISLITVEVIGMWYIEQKMVIPQERFYAAIYVFQMSLISFVLLFLQVPFTASVMAHERMNFYSLMNLIDAILKLISALVLPYITYDRLVLYGIFISSISFFNLITFAIYSFKNFEEINLQWNFHKLPIKPLLTFSSWNLWGSISGVMKEQGLNMILNLFFGPVVNAARGVSYQVSAGLQGLVGNLHTTIRPQLIQSYAINDNSRVKTLMEFLSKYSCLFLILISYPIFLETDFILSLWLGSNVPSYTSVFIRIILIINIVNNLNSAVSMVIHATGKMFIYQTSTSLVTLLAIPFSYIAFKNNFSAEWGFIITCVFTVLSQCVSIIILKRLFPYTIREYMKNVIIPLSMVIFSSMWIPLIIHCHYEIGLLRFVIVTATSVFCTCYFTYLVGMTKEEKNFVKKRVRK